MSGLLQNYKTVPLAKLKKAEWNYKTDDPILLEKLKANIKKNGQIENILIRDLGDGFHEIVNGNHRYDALLQLEIQEAVAYDLGAIDLNTAKLIATETNETRFESDQVKLAQLITELSKTTPVEELMKTLPWDQERLQNMISMTEFNWDEFNKKQEEAEKAGLGSGYVSDDFFKMELNLPKEVAEKFIVQLNRIKRRLEPDSDPEQVSYVKPIECIVAHMAMIPDENLL